MCSAYNEPSFSERVQCYISRKEEIEAEYKSKMKALKKKLLLILLLIAQSKLVMFM